MLHLLPEQHKKGVLIEYRKRLVIVSCLFVVALALIGTALLTPSYIYSSQRHSEIERAKNQLAQGLQTQEGDQVAETVKNINNNIEALQPLGAKQLPTEVVKHLVSETAGGITLISLVYDIDDHNNVTLDVTGKADARNDLTMFVKTLQLDPYFVGAKLPLSNFTRERNIDFNMKLEVKGVSTSSTTH